MPHKESTASFARRVKDLTGFEFASLPTGELLDLKSPGSRVICRRGKTHVIRVTNPGQVKESDGDGGHTWEQGAEDVNNFRVITLED